MGAAARTSPLVVDPVVRRERMAVLLVGSAHGVKSFLHAAWLSPASSRWRTFGIVTTGFNIGGTFGPLAYGWLMDNNLPRAVFVGPSERRRRGSGRLRGSRRAS
jgi:hypothetical protein